MSQLIQIVGSGVASAFSLYREMAVSARQVFPEFRAPARAAKSLRLRMEENSSNFARGPIRSRSPHPLY